VHFNNNTAKSDIYFSFPTPILRGGDTFDLRAVFSGSYAWFNIAATDTIVFTAGTVTFPAGNYTVSDIVARVNTVLGIPAFLSFERTTGKITATSTATFDLMCTALSGRLGFEEPPHEEGEEPIVSSSEGPPSTHTMVADHPVNLTKTHSLAIVSDLWTNSLDSMTHAGDMLLTSPITAAPFEFFSLTSVRPVSGRAISDRRGLQVRVLDHDNNLIDFNNQDWELVLYINVIASQPFVSFVPTLGKTDKEGSDTDKADKA